jgi:hypothetical protein
MSWRDSKHDVQAGRTGREEARPEVYVMPNDDALLSIAHIRRNSEGPKPFIEYSEGASLLKVSKGGVSPQVGGGKRKAITGFSRGSRQRLMQLIARVRRDADLPCFVTLTYPEKFPTVKEAKEHIELFKKRLGYHFPGHGTIEKLEPQQRGAPHFHLLVWNLALYDLMTFVPQAWYEIAGEGDEKHLRWHLGLCGYGNKHCVQQVRSFKGVWFYAAKYLGKTFDVAGWSEQWTGRYWSVWNKENIPFGSFRARLISYEQAVRTMRLQRRFIRSRKVRKKKIYPSRSLSIFCDADQWVEKLYPISVDGENS